MTTLTVMSLVVAAGLLAYGVLALVNWRSTPLDTEREERWFVAHAPGPLRRLLSHADRRMVGGAALMLVFLIVFTAATAIGWIFDTIDEDQGFARFDESAAEFGAENASDTSTRVLEAITQLGATGWLLLVMAVIGVIEAWHFRKVAVLGYLAAVGHRCVADQQRAQAHRRARTTQRIATHVGQRVLVPLRAHRSSGGLLGGDRARRRPPVVTTRTAGGCGRGARDHTARRRQPGACSVSTGSPT